MRARRWVQGLVLLWGALAMAQPPDARPWHRLVGILQYLQTDYPAAVQSQDPLELEEQRALLREARQTLTQLGPAGEPFRTQLESVGARIDQGKDASSVEHDLSQLVTALAQAGHLVRAPRAPPDLAEGQALFQAQCTSCHGPEGRGDGPAAAALTPRPADFHGDRMADISPYQVFNTVAFGIPKTAMVPFPGLNEDQRWAVAFYISGLRQPRCHGAAPPVSLEALANASDRQLAQRYGADAVACLRRELQPPSAQDGLRVARLHVEKAQALAVQGSWDLARQEVVDGYLEGVEPVEPRLRAKAPELVPHLEAAFLKTRVAAERRSPDFARETGALLASLESLDAATGAGAGVARFASVFWMALLVIVREGFEATIVVAALLAVLKKMDQQGHARVVHAGWILALVAGAISYWVGRRLLAGANREWMEGIVALVAVGMLLYAALWLNARAQVSRYMGELRTRLQGALGRGSAAGLFFIAFSAVFRECFEAALFLQGLSIDSPRGALWGAAGGMAVMVGVVLAIGRIGYRLPMKPLFKASTVLLFATAVILLGKGLHALQEVGALPLRPFPFFTFEPLGIFPDVISLAPQLVLALAPLVWKLASPKPPAPESTPVGTAQPQR